jgi:hypothetical protein
MTWVNDPFDGFEIAHSHRSDGSFGENWLFPYDRRFVLFN